MKKILLLLFITLLISNCGTRPSTKNSRIGLPENIKIGVSNISEIKEKLGEPSLTSKNEDNSYTAQYENVGSVLVDGEVVKAFFRGPKGDEVHLQYWLQRWKNFEVSTQELPRPSNVNESDKHIEKEMQKICKKDQTTIIFDEKTGLVKRVIFYEK